MKKPLYGATIRMNDTRKKSTPKTLLIMAAVRATVASFCDVALAWARMAPEEKRTISWRRKKVTRRRSK
jgi:hypothetical protein